MKTAIIGSGLAGLTAASYLARAGHDVCVFERRTPIGGRAHTQRKEGFCFNLAPHALYRGGIAEQVLGELGVTVRGADPLSVKCDRFAWNDGKSHILPTGPLSMLKTDLLTLRDKMAFGAILNRLRRIEPITVRGTSVGTWLESVTQRPRVRALMHALVRLTSYVDYPEDFDAEVAVGQLRFSIEAGVDYLHGGWATLVADIRNEAETNGARFTTATKVERVLLGEGVRLRTADGVLPFDNCVVATGARAAGALLDTSFDVMPLRAASLTLALASEAPRQQSPFGLATFAMGLDHSVYYSAHHDVADLAHAGGQLVHVLQYLGPEATADRGLLETMLDRMQPGWRDYLIHAAYQPKLTVTWDVPLASRGGLAGRTPVATEDPNVVLAGDWIGAEGHLAYAAFASGRRAAQMLSTHAKRAA